MTAIGGFVQSQLSKAFGQSVAQIRREFFPEAVELVKLCRRLLEENDFKTLPEDDPVYE